MPATTLEKTKPKSDVLTAEPNPDYSEFVTGFAWEGRALRVGNPEAIPKIRRKNFSASSKGDMTTCPAMFAIKSVLPRVMGPLEPAPLGNVSHEGLEHFYDLPADERTLDALLQHTEAAARAHVKPYEDTECYDELYKQVWDQVSVWVQGIYKLEDPTLVDVYATEQEFKGGQPILDDAGQPVIDPATGQPRRTPPVLLSNGVPFVGYLDRTDRGTNGRLKIRDYKGLALDTPIPTPGGWTTIGKLAVGDEVLSPSGRITRVTLKSEVHNRPCYELSFSDGAKVVSDHVHDWVVSEAMNNGSRTLQVEAQELHAVFHRNVAKGRSESIFVENTLPVSMDTVDLPVHPYVLGAWLGDGRTRSGEICSGNTDAHEMHSLLQGLWTGTVSRHEEAIAIFRFAKPDPNACAWGHDRATKLNGSPRTNTKSCLFCLRLQRNAATRPAAVNGTLTRRLGELGVLDNKHIPLQYLRASAEQREELVRGLMDTDGSWNPQRNRAVFITTKDAIASGMYELLVSLGVTVQRFVNTRTGGKPAHMLEFTPLGFNPFKLSRKANPVAEFRQQSKRWQKNGLPAKAFRRLLTDIREVESVPTQCIKVDDPTEMFLCGEGFIPTHNTGAKVKKPSAMFGDQYGDQMRLYKDVIETNTDYEVEDALLLWPRQGQVIPAELSAGAVKATLNDFKREFDNMNAFADTGTFPTKPGNLCAWCPAANSCPVANIKSANAVNHAKQMPGGSDPAAPVALGIPRVHTDVREAFTEPRVAASDPAPRIATGTSTPTESIVNQTVAGVQPVPFPNNKWAAKAVTRVSDAAAVHLAIHEQPVDLKAVAALTRTLGTIVEQAGREAFIGEFDWSFDAATETTAAVVSTLRGNPAPFGKPRSDWEAWQAEVLRISIIKLNAGVRLLGAGNPEAALDYLVSTTILEN